MTLSLFCLPRLHLFDQKYSKKSIIVKYYGNLKWSMLQTIFVETVFSSGLFDDKKNQWTPFIYNIL